MFLPGRILRFALTLALALLLSIAAALAVAPSWNIRLIVVLALWLAMGAVVWHRREWYYSRASRPFRLALLVGMLAVGVFLAWDDAALQRPQTMARVTPFLRSRPLRPLVQLAYNPRATANVVAEHFELVAAAAEERKIDFLTTGMVEKLERNRRPRLKNLGGALMLEMGIPALGKVIDNAWKKNDARLELIADVKSRLGVATSD